MWTQSIYMTKSGGKSRRVQLFGLTSCLGASTRSTWSTSGVFHSVLPSQRLGLSYVVDFLPPYLLSASQQPSSRVHPQFLSVRAWVSLTATSNSSGGLMSARTLSLPFNSSLVDWTARNFLIYFHTWWLEGKQSYTVEHLIRFPAYTLISGDFNLTARTSSSERECIIASTHQNTTKKRYDLSMMIRVVKSSESPQSLFPTDN